MEVRVKFYGNFRPLLGTSEVRVEVGEQSTPFDVVRLLAEQCGPKVRAALLVERDEKVRLQSGVRMAMGDEIIDFVSDLHKPFIEQMKSSTPIELFIFPGLVGG